MEASSQAKYVTEYWETVSHVMYDPASPSFLAFKRQWDLKIAHFHIIYWGLTKRSILSHTVLPREFISNSRGLAIVVLLCFQKCP